MQKLILVSGKEIPVKNVVRWQGKEMIDISIAESDLVANGLDFSTVLELLKDAAETAEMKLVNDADVLENAYYAYSKLDSYSVAYDEISSNSADLSSEEEETAEVSKDTVITVSIKKLSDLEQQVANNTDMLESVTVAIASMMGV